ncbi:MAG: hypothetical protein CMJ98_02895 [Planctomycetes bacterium]|jgi:hypothetical protein|nr:hypothetical protein [Planctomycetota bacterium]
MLLQNAPRIVDIQVEYIIPSPPKEKRRVAPAYRAAPARDENGELGSDWQENTVRVKATKLLGAGEIADSPSASEATEDSSTPK